MDKPYQDSQPTIYCGDCLEGMMELPDDRRIAEAYSSGQMIVEKLPDYKDHFVRLARQLRSYQ